MTIISLSALGIKTFLLMCKSLLQKVAFLKIYCSGVPRRRRVTIFFIDLSFCAPRVWSRYATISQFLILRVCSKISSASFCALLIVLFFSSSAVVEARTSLSLQPLESFLVFNLDIIIL